MVGYRRCDPTGARLCGDDGVSPRRRCGAVFTRCVMCLAMLLSVTRGPPKLASHHPSFTRSTPSSRAHPASSPQNSEAVLRRGLVLLGRIRWGNGRFFFFSEFLKLPDKACTSEGVERTKGGEDVNLLSSPRPFHPPMIDVQRSAAGALLRGAAQPATHSLHQPKRNLTFFSSPLLYYAFLSSVLFGAEKSTDDETGTGGVKHRDHKIKGLNYLKTRSNATLHRPTTYTNTSSPPPPPPRHPTPPNIDIDIAHPPTNRQHGLTATDSSTTISRRLGLTTPRLECLRRIARNRQPVNLPAAPVS